MNTKLKLLVMPNSQELGNKINQELQKLNHSSKNYLLDFEANRFNNGEGKIKLKEPINNTELYILSDVGNYGQTYQMHNFTHHMSPDEHFEDIKRAIASTSGHATKINVIMPLLYEARQHKRRGNESLDCAISLQELEKMGVDNIITFDAHDPSICNAIPCLPFENFYPTHTILEQLIKNEQLENVLVVSPDMGAMERARYYADMINTNIGVFYKRRDLTKVVNGKNPIIEHLYMGPSPENKDILVVDDMISSGTSMLEVAEKLKKQSARNIYLISTFALFTEGIEEFNQAFNNKIFTKVYTTNLSYIPEDIKATPWLETIDISKYLAQIINTIYNKEDLEPLWNPKKSTIQKINSRLKGI